MFLAHHVYVLSQLEVFVNFILLKNVAKFKKTLINAYLIFKTQKNRFYCAMHYSATNFKFCTHIHIISQKKSPSKFSQKVAVGVLMGGTLENF